MDVILVSIFWIFIAFLMGWAICRQVRAHRELHQSIRQLESNYKHLVDRFDSVVETLENATELPFEREKVSPLQGAYCIKHFEEKGSSPFYKTSGARGLVIVLGQSKVLSHMRSSDDIARLWQDDEEYESVPNGARWAH